MKTRASSAMRTPEARAATAESDPIVVVGAGAAGLVAACFACEGGRPVTLLESTKEGGRKILISGGGRCNVLPEELEPSRFITASSARLLKRLLLSWPLREQKKFFEEELRVPLRLEAETRKYFPVSNRAREVRDALLQACRRRGVSCRFSNRVTGVAPFPDRRGWGVGLDSGETVSSSCVILATGGLSVPSTGSDGTGLRIAANLGVRVHPTYPALTPLVAEPPLHADLAGVSLTVRLESRGADGRRVATGGFLFTHRGYSGPAVLDLSHCAVLSRLRGGPAESITVNWCDRSEEEWEAILSRGKGRVEPLLRRHLPERLVLRLLAEAGVDRSTLLSHFPRDQRRRLVDRLVRYPLPWTSDEGYARAEVTGGGVALEEVDPATMESRRHPGVFFCGEMLDAFGPIGGHNFAWAWSTGRLAGLGAAQKVGATMAQR